MSEGIMFIISCVFIIFAFYFGTFLGEMKGRSDCEKDRIKALKRLEELSKDSYERYEEEKPIIEKASKLLKIDNMKDEIWG